MGPYLHFSPLLLLFFQVEPRSLVELTAQLEPEACYQLLFCALADETIKVDKDVEAVKKLVISSPGKYKEAHKFGLAG